MSLAFQIMLVTVIEYVVVVLVAKAVYCLLTRESDGKR